MKLDCREHIEAKQLHLDSCFLFETLVKLENFEPIFPFLVFGHG
jgi:hypothetical protein